MSFRAELRDAWWWWHYAVGGRLKRGLGHMSHAGHRKSNPKADPQ